MRTHKLSIDESSVIRLNAPLAVFRNHPSYAAAKAGSTDAALDVIFDFYDNRFNDDIQKFRGAVFVFPHPEEGVGRNQLPRALAALVADQLGCQVHADIVQVNRTHHTGSSMAHRLATRAVFAGPVSHGQAYVIVEDNVTSGATVADTASYIQENGGHTQTSEAI